MLGHASAAMTLDVYAGLFGDDLDALADRLDAAFGDWIRTRCGPLAADEPRRSSWRRGDAPWSGVMVEPPKRIELLTYALRVRCSAI